MKKLHKKGTVARKIQDYFMSGAYYDMIEGGSEWCWFPIPNNPEFCVALEWQGGYDPDDKEEYYGDFMDGEYCINASIKFTDEFRLNGEFAYYAEYYFNEEEDDELCGGMSLTISDVENDFYQISESLAIDFKQFNRMKRRR